MPRSFRSPKFHRTDDAVSRATGGYRNCVIGGPGAFMIPVRERHQFAESITTKII
jgi:Protein of unknown function (DUF1194)